LLDNSPPAGYARWTGPLLARELGDVDVQYVWRFMTTSGTAPPCCLQRWKSPNCQLRVILDNLSTHKKNEEWLQAHHSFHTRQRVMAQPGRDVVFDHTGAIVEGRIIHKPQTARADIDAYIKAYNVKAEPFV